MTPTADPVMKPPRAKTAGLYSTVVQSVWFSYLTLIALQIKVAWDMWRVRDLTSGDTSYYFVTAYDWFKNGTTLITWSPMYTLFYGSLLHLTTNAMFVTLAHRLLIVLVVAVLVLAVMRAFLPPAIAWMMAAWWALLPIDFDALYEVHLFVLIPLLITTLIAVRGRRVHRGITVAGLLATGLLMRNEMLLATGIFALAAAAYEIWLYRTKHEDLSVRVLLLSYVVPVAVVLVLAGAIFERSTDRKILDAMLARKHSLNVCQIYAFGYQQRHNDWAGSPWTECQALMQKQFGVPEPAMTKAVIANPRAMLEHFLWNVTLIPNGLEMLLFNRMAGQVNPDYVPSPGTSTFAAICTGILLLILTFGVYQLVRSRQPLPGAEFMPRVWGWIVLGCLSAVTLVVIVMQRPRPSYMFALGISIRVLVGLCCTAILVSTKMLDIVRRVYPAIAVVLIVFMPSYYAAQPNPAQNSLGTLYSRLRPFEFLFETPGVKFAAIGWGPELCNYLGKRSENCKSLPYAQLREQVSAGTSLGDVLNKEDVNVFYAEESVLADTAGRDFMTDPAPSGWKRIGSEELPGQSWMLFKKTAWGTDTPAALAEIVPRGQGLTLGEGWYGFEKFDGQTFRWMKNDGEIRIAKQANGPAALVFDAEPGPGIKSLPLRLHLIVNEKELKTVTLAGRLSIKVELTPALRKQDAVLRLHVDGEGKPTPNDSRILNIRVFKIERAAAN